MSSQLAEPEGSTAHHSPRDHAFIVYDAAPGHAIIDVNPAWSAITGYSREEAIGKDGVALSILQGPLTDPAALRLIRTAIGLEESVTVQLLSYRKDGTTFWRAPARPLHPPAPPSTSTPPPRREWRVRLRRNHLSVSPVLADHPRVGTIFVGTIEVRQLDIGTDVTEQDDLIGRMQLTEIERIGNDGLLARMRNLVALLKQPLDTEPDDGTAVLR